MHMISRAAAPSADGDATPLGHAVGWCVVEGKPYLIVESDEAGSSDQTGCSSAFRLNGRMFSVVKGPVKPPPSNFDQLTPRELEIALLIGRGNDYKTVARLLMISFYTVRGHVERIYSKLGVHKQTELARLIAIHLGITSVLEDKDSEDLFGNRVCRPVLTDVVAATLPIP
jgi:DNA-binding CsgD family transcriptional regulator